MTPKDFFDLAKKNNAEMIDLKFVDMLGTWQHCSYPIEEWDEGTFENGVGFDGSSIRGWQAINMSDMLAIPDATTAKIDPFFKEPTISVIANIVDPITRPDVLRSADLMRSVRKPRDHQLKKRPKTRQSTQIPVIAYPCITAWRLGAQVDLFDASGSISQWNWQYRNTHTASAHPGLHVAAIAAENRARVRQHRLQPAVVRHPSECGFQRQQRAAGAISRDRMGDSPA